MVTKKEIEEARNRYWLKEAKKQLGSKIKSLKQVKVISKKTPKFIPLGRRLTILSNNRKKGFSSYKKK